MNAQICSKDWTEGPSLVEFGAGSSHESMQPNLLILQKKNTKL